MTDEHRPAPQYPAAWYPAPDGSNRWRYYDGTAWTEQYAPRTDPGAGAAASAAPRSGRRPRLSKPLVALVGGLAAVLVVSGAVAAAGAGRPSTDAAIGPSASATASASAARPTPTTTPTPGPTFSTDEPGDPATVQPATEAAAVVIADSSTTTGRTALDLLATLAVKGRAPLTGYDRTGDFGPAWVDVDRNGCDTRNDVLARDLTGTSRAGSCTVMSGSLTSPYTGAHIDFVRGEKTSPLVQIDHVVALADAWQTGAQQLTQAQRMSFANDPLNLLAVDGASNEQKGSGDAATWLPKQTGFRCAYVARQVSVKATYGLWVTPAEHDAIARILSACPSEAALTSAFAPAPKPVVTATPTAAPAPVPAQPSPSKSSAKPAPAPAPAQPAPQQVVPQQPAPQQPAPAPVTDVYYQNCTAARAAGAAPIYAGQPGYRPALDRDGDGIACE